ncbi:MAG: methyltransferase [Bacteroides sp.]|nr:methyltransferase [Bacteroides sp.]
MFKFKQFTIDDTRCEMKVGTDSVLLGSWVDVTGVRKILDAGCGSGLLAIMAAQRTTDAKIDAIEFDSNACSDALNNVADSAFSNRITVICSDIVTYDFASAKYDMIISNPPFFTESLRSPSSGRAASRHEGEFGVEWLLKHASRLLDSEGSLAFIAPASRDEEIAFKIELSRLHIQRHCEVIPVAGRPSKRTLWQVSPTQGGTPAFSSLTIRNSDGSSTDEYISLTSEFYL